MMAIDDVVQLLSIDLLGIVADSDDVITASNKGEPIAFQPNSTVSISYRNIARRILGENVPLQSLTEEKGFFKKDRKSTRLNSSHVSISYAVFCLKQKI